MVVSEINDRLSPKNEPPSTTATIIAASVPVSAAICEANGVSATMVPTEVPSDIDMKQAVRNSPGITTHVGITLSAKSTVASTAPIPTAKAENDPAKMNIQIM